MTSKNDITGDALRTRGPSKEYLDGWDRIFGKKSLDKEPEFWYHVCKHNGVMDVEKNQACNWCGEREDGTLD
jgi:hypothetical protein